MGKATFFIQFERKSQQWVGYGKGTHGVNNEYIWVLRPVAMTLTAPRVRRGVVLTKLTVEIPDEAFEPLVPEATIKFGLNEVETMTVTPEPIEADEA